MRCVALTRRLLGSVVFISALVWGTQAAAQITVGTWVRTDAQGKGITMTAELCCGGGRRLVYRVPATGGHAAMTLTVDSPMDGSEVPALVGGQPSGETMAVKRLDERHYSAVVRMGGKIVTTSNGTLSADGKTLTVESVTGGQKIIETWVKQ